MRRQEEASVAGQVAAFRAALPGSDDLSDLSDDERLGLLRELELLTRTVAGLGARVQVAFYTSRSGPRWRPACARPGPGRESLTTSPWPG